MPCCLQKALSLSPLGAASAITTRQCTRSSSAPRGRFSLFMPLAWGPNRRTRRWATGRVLGIRTALLGREHHQDASIELAPRGDQMGGVQTLAPQRSPDRAGEAGPAGLVQDALLELGGKGRHRGLATNSGSGRDTSTGRRTASPARRDTIFFLRSTLRSIIALLSNQ